MNKLFKLVLVSSVVLGSLHAFAEEVDDMSLAITEGKIVAAQMMTQVEQIQNVKKHIDTVISKRAAEGSGLTGTGLGEMSGMMDLILDRAQKSSNEDEIDHLWSEAMEIEKDLNTLEAGK